MTLIFFLCLKSLISPAKFISLEISSTAAGGECNSPNLLKDWRNFSSAAFFDRDDT